MTQMTTFTGSFTPKNVSVYTDFIASAHPFSIGASASLTAAATISNENSSYTLETGPYFGKVALTLGTVTSPGVFAYAGAYLSPTFAAGSDPTKEFRLGKGRCRLAARIWAMNFQNQDTATVFCLGFSSCERTADVRPAADFVGFHTFNSSAKLKAGYTANSVITSVTTNQISGQTKAVNLEVEVNELATWADFRVNDRLVAGMEISPRKSIGLVPCIELRGLVAGGSVNDVVNVDWIRLDVETLR
jgi:hypothetical protein